MPPRQTGSRGRRLAAAAARALIEGKAAALEFAGTCQSLEKECAEALAAPLLLRPGWDETAWAAYNPAEQQKVLALPGALCLGRLETSAGADGPSSACLVPFIGRRRTLVFASVPQNRQAVLDGVQSVVWRIAAALPNQVQFLFIDPHNSGNAFRWANRLPGRLENTELFQDLDAAERNFIRIGKANSLGWAGVESFRSSVTSAGGKKLRIVVVADFPRGFGSDSRSLELLRRVANNGMEGGTYLLLHWDTTAEVPRGFEMDGTGIAAFQHAYYALRCPRRSRSNMPAAGWCPITPPSNRLSGRAAGETGQGRNDPGRTRFCRSWSPCLPEQWWRQSAAERVTTPIGTRGSESDLLRILFR